MLLDENLFENDILNNDVQMESLHDWDQIQLFLNLCNVKGLKDLNQIKSFVEEENNKGVSFLDTITNYKERFDDDIQLPEEETAFDDLNLDLDDNYYEDNIDLNLTDYDDNIYEDDIEILTPNAQIIKPVEGVKDISVLDDIKQNIQFIDEPKEKNENNSNAIDINVDSSVSYDDEDFDLI